MKTEVERQKILSQRLRLAVALPSLLMMLVGLVLGQQILRMADDMKWVQHTERVISLATQAELGIAAREGSVRGFLLTEDAMFLDRADQQTSRVEFDALIALVADNPVQQERLKAVKADYEAWRALIERDVILKDVPLARSVAQVKMRSQRMHALRDVLKQAMDDERSLLGERLKASQRTTRQTIWVFLITLALAIISLAIISRRQLSSVGALFSDALMAEEKARRETADEAWIRAGLMKLSIALQGNKTPIEVARSALTEIANYVRADIGSIFLWQDDAWVRRAKLAVADNICERFKEGEGLIGLVAQTGEVRELSPLPEGYLQLRSGTGQGAPSLALIVPSQVSGTTQAVLEFGFLEAPNARTKALMHRLGENIALALRAAYDRERLKDLLEETQRQAEELQSQQEELRVQNEELESQSSTLQESRSNLMNQQAELEQINAQLEEHTQALQAERSALIRARTDLERANTYKSEFLANMSHELRTPLNSSLILAKLLASNREGNLNEEQVKFANTIYSSGNDLLALINDILDLSKIEAGKLDMRLSKVPLAQVAEELKSVFSPIAQEKNLPYRIQLAEDLPIFIETDGQRLQQILKNLLSNALKFTDSGEVVLKIGRVEGNHVSFSVRDTGIGIAPEYHQTIFEAFRQADGATTRKYGGTGLGLSISRDLAKLLGGRIELESAPGKGSTFTLVLPQAQASTLGTPQASPPSKWGAREMVAPMPPPRTSAPKMTYPGTGVTSDDRNAISRDDRTLLIVEDDLVYAKTLAELAKDLQFKALVASTAQEAVELAQAFRPSAILLDVGLPDRSGLSVLDQLKHDSALRHIPVHMISASDYSQASLEMGAIGYAVKPLGRDKLMETLQKIQSKLNPTVKRVLVVEDDPTHRDSTCKLLNAEDVQTVGVATAKDAEQKLREATFDCMILDLTLPDKSGLDLLEGMSIHDSISFPPVVVYTGKSLSRQEEERLQKYARSIVIKGARSPERLLDEVTLFLHQVEADLPAHKQKMLREARHRESIFDGRKVLVVEDDVRNVFALSSLLEPRGAKVEISRNGREAVDFLRKQTVDIVLMDIMMPEMDGIQATKEIRKLPQHQKLPIIALTAKAMSDDREKCMQAGASDYIAKPLDVDKLLSLLRVWMPR